MAAPTHAVLTTGSSLSCAHGGRISVSSRQHKLTVDGRPALLPGDLIGASISGCATPVTNSTAQCLHVVSVLVGASHTLAVDGAPVLMDTARGLTDGIVAVPTPGPGTWSASTAGQRKLAAS